MRVPMPPAGSPYAPKTFDGQDDEIQEFLEQFETCAKDARLHDTEMVGYLMRYLTRRQKDIFEAFDGYEENDWPRFLASIKYVFPMAFRPKHTRRSLAQFTSESAKHPIQSISALAAYYREFNAIARYLLKEELVDEDVINRQFWFGLHELTRQWFSERLKKVYKRNGFYPYAGVFKAGVWVFERDEGFDWMVDLYEEPTTPEDEAPFSSLPDDEMSSLLVRLSHLSVQDSEYAVIYNKVKTISPSTAAVIKQPTAIPHPASTTATNSAACAFCKDTSGSHRTRKCPVGKAYMKDGKVTINSKGYWELANGDRIPNHRLGLMYAVDQHYAQQPSTQHMQTVGSDAPTNSSSVADILLALVGETNIDDDDVKKIIESTYWEIMDLKACYDGDGEVTFGEILRNKPTMRKLLADLIDKIDKENSKMAPSNGDGDDVISNRVLKSIRQKIMDTSSRNGKCVGLTLEEILQIVPPVRKRFAEYIERLNAEDSKVVAPPVQRPSDQPGHERPSTYTALSLGCYVVY